MSAPGFRRHYATVVHRRGRRLGALGLVVLGAGLLAGCSGGSPGSVLTNAAMPANLKLKQNNGSVAASLASVFNKTYPGCTGSYAVFTVGGRLPTPALSGAKIYPQVYSESANCTSDATAQSVFQGVVKKVTSFGAKTITGVGDGAILATSSSGKANSYVIFWRKGSVLASVQLSGPASDSRISAAETELLAHRQIALS